MKLFKIFSLVALLSVGSGYAMDALPDALQVQLDKEDKREEAEVEHIAKLCKEFKYLNHDNISAKDLHDDAEILGYLDLADIDSEDFSEILGELNNEVVSFFYEAQGHYYVEQARFNEAQNSIQGIQEHISRKVVDNLNNQSQNFLFGFFLYTVTVLRKDLNDTSEVLSVDNRRSLHDLSTKIRNILNGSALL